MLLYICIIPSICCCNRLHASGCRNDSHSAARAFRSSTLMLVGKVWLTISLQWENYSFTELTFCTWALSRWKQEKVLINCFQQVGNKLFTETFLDFVILKWRNVCVQPWFCVTEILIWPSCSLCHYARIQWSNESLRKVQLRILEQTIKTSPRLKGERSVLIHLTTLCTLCQCNATDSPFAKLKLPFFSNVPFSCWTVTLSCRIP